MKNYQALSLPLSTSLGLRLRLITANFGLDNSSYRAQHHSIIVKYMLVNSILLKHSAVSALLFCMQSLGKLFEANTCTRCVPIFAAERSEAAHYS
jgi:hypothetical protein